MIDFQKIEDIRKSKGITIAWVLKQVGINRTTYFNWQNGLKEPREANIDKLLEVLDIKKEDISIVE